MRRKRFIRLSLVAFILVTLILIIHDLFLWRTTNAHINEILSLEGHSYQDAVAFLNLQDNRISLSIADVREYKNGSRTWIIVELNHVSVIGTIASSIGTTPCFSGMEISGLVQLHVDEGHISSCNLVF
jgi:hypothetical protein